MSNDSSDVLVSEPPGKRIAFCVTVPARDEEELLPSALRALAEQKTLSGEALDHELYEVILLINNTRDRSRHVAEQFQRLYPTFRLHIAERNFAPADSHNGHARRLLMDEACRRLEGRGDGEAVILSTDSDSQVAPNWIARNREELAAGAEAVGGRIVVLPYEEALLDPATRMLHRYDHLYRRLVAWLEDSFDPQAHDPWPRHHQHFGASLAMSPRVYKLVGRIPPRRYLEDIAFYQSLIRHDVRLRHSNRVRVFTSARLSGRALYGLSTELSDWLACGMKGLRVPRERHSFLEFLFTTRRRLRLLWLDYRDTGDLPMHCVRELSAQTGIRFSDLVEQIQSTRHFGLILEETDFYKKCRKQWTDQARLAPLKRVVDELQFVFNQRTRDGARAHRSGTTQHESLTVSAILTGPKSARAHRLPEADTPIPVRANGLTAAVRPKQHDQ